MASAIPPVKGAAFTTYTSLVSQADTDTFQVAPTLAAGDVVVIKDGVLDGNIDTLPVAVTSATKVLAVALSAAEMTADVVTVIFSDAAGSEWQDQVITIYTAAQTFDTTDGVADTISGKIIGTLATGTHSPQSGDAYAVVSNATYGNSALNTDIDAILQDTGTTIDDLVDDLESRLTETRAGYLDNLAFVTSGSVTVTSPVNSDGTLLTLVRGDDYNATDGLELGFSGTSWPTLTSATIAFTVKRNGVTLISTAGSVITATGATKHVHVELTAAQTGLLPVGTKACQYDVQATLATSNRIVTLARGDVTVLEDYT